MQITCSKCKKVYNVDLSRIPAGVTGTRCKACGNSIPLRQSAPHTPPPGPPQAAAAEAKMMQITCQYCSKQYKINPKAIPQGLKSTKCKACGHMISLTPSAAPAPKPQPAKTVASNRGVKEISCLFCGKKYSINAGKIPSGLTTIKCKACGRPISLRAADSQIPPLKNKIDKKVIRIEPQKDRAGKAAVQDLPPVLDPGKPVYPIWRRPALLAAAAGIIIVLLAGYFVGTHWAKLTGNDSGVDKIAAKKPAIHQKKSAAGARAEAEPFMAAIINVPRLMEAIDQNLPEEKKDIKYRMIAGIFKSFDLSDIQLFLYPDPEHTFLPVIIAESKDGARLEKQLTSQENFIPFIEPESKGIYRFNTKAIPRDKLNNFPIEQYRLQFRDNTAVFAPRQIANRLKNGQGPVLKTPVARMIASTAKPGNLAALSVRIPQDFSKDWQKSLQNNPAVQQNPQAAMMIAMGGSVLSQLSESLKGIEMLAIGFRLDEKNGRALSYAQQFREGMDGSRIYQQLKSGNPSDLNVDGMVLKLIELFNDPRYQHRLEQNNNRLALELNWEMQQDKAVLTSLSEATLGQLFAQSMDLTPSEGPISAQYADSPRLSPTIDNNSLKQMIPGAVEQGLFPANYWSFGDQPRMTLELDTIEIPNASLAQMTYKVLDVTSTDGKSIMRVEENPFQHILQPGSASPGNIDINVQAGTPAEALATAKIHFNISMPVRLKKLEFDSGDIPGTVRESDGVRVKLGRLEKDVAKVTYGGGESARLFAFDETGRSLASRESMSSSSSATTRFQGEISTLMVVVVQEMLDYPFEVEVDLNRGKELTLSHKPENPERLRYNHHPVQTYEEYAEDQLSDLEVVWKEAGGMSWTDSLNVTMPKGPFNGDIQWEVHFFGEREPVYLSGNSFFGSTEISYSLSNGDLKKAHAAFGKVQMDLSSKIRQLSFVKKSEGKTVTQNLPSGKPVKVSFNKNEITFDAGKAKIIQMMAFDGQGRRLRKDNYTGMTGNKTKIYFWGLPTRFVIDVATETLKHTVDFDIQQRPVDEASYTKFKADINNHREIVKTLRQISRATNKDRTKYGDDIAGLFYLYDPKNNKPMRLIDEQVAHSDPAGRERFGYALKPYKGYYFTVLSGVQSGNVKNDYMRMPGQKTFTWENGSFKTTPLMQRPDLVAIPKDEDQPTFFIQFNQVYMKPLNGTKLTYLPEDYYSKGWVEATFVES
jgi:zinc-ribbon domain